MTFLVHVQGFWTLERRVTLGTIEDLGRVVTVRVSPEVAAGAESFVAQSTYVRAFVGVCSHVVSQMSPPLKSHSNADCTSVRTNASVHVAVSPKAFLAPEGLVTLCAWKRLLRWRLALLANGRVQSRDGFSAFSAGPPVRRGDDAFLAEDQF